MTESSEAANQEGGYTLIVPAVAVGNVPQLAVDLLIYNARMKKFRQLFSPDFIPFLGAHPYDKNCTDVCTTADFYIDQEKRIIALQIRSPPFNKLDNFFEKLRDFVAEQKISKVVVLSSEWQYAGSDDRLRNERTTRYVACASLEHRYARFFHKFQWTKLEIAGDDSSNPRRIRIHGGGFAASLYDYLDSQNIPCALLLKFCSEGDNSPDAKELAHFSNQWLSLVVAKNKSSSLDWKEPPSWRHIYGREPPRRVY